jgi:RNA polymerase sigma factor (sigma-70 family)
VCVCNDATVRSGPAVTRDAIAAFCRAEYPRLVGSLTLHCGSRAIAEELAQEALIRACQHWRRVRRLDNPGAWVNRVALNLASSHLRRTVAEARARARLASLREDDDSASDDLHTHVREAVTELPLRHRTALILRFYVGLSVAEAAHEMGCPEGTVKRLTHEAIKKLRKELSAATLEEARDGS